MNDVTNSNDNDLRDAVAEIRGEQRYIRAAIERMATALERLTAVEARAATRDAQIEDHEKRIRALEAGWLKAVGAGAVVSALVSLGIAKVGALF